MARIQILQLPPYGRDGEHPFAVIVDQCATPPIRTMLRPADPPTLPPGQEQVWAVPPVEITDGWQRFGQEIGARSVLVTDETVDIVDGTAGEDEHLVEFDHAALAESFATALRFHLESPEASDALRAWYDRRAATDQQSTEVHHHHHHADAMQEFVARSEARRRGGQ